MRKKLQSPADSPKVAQSQDDYETKDHLNTIIRAHEIISDPERMKKVHALAGRHMKAIKSIKDMKAAIQEKFGQQEKPAKDDGDTDDSSK